MGNVANVISGPGAIYVAPQNTAAPGFSAGYVWGSPFVASGYTDKGITFDYTPTFKDIEVDEEMSPVQKLLTKEKLVISLEMAETTLANLNYAISGSTLAGTTLSVGSAVITNEFALGFQGPCPPQTGAAVGTIGQRFIFLFRVKAIAAVKAHWTRLDKVMFSVQLEAMAQSTQPAGARLCVINDF